MKIFNKFNPFTLSNSTPIYQILLPSIQLDYVCNAVMPYCKEGGDQHF